MSIKMHFPATLYYTPYDCNTTLQNKRQHQLIFPLFDYNGYAVYVCLTVMLPATASAGASNKTADGRPCRPGIRSTHTEVLEK